VCVRKLHSRS